jgi:DNA-binding LacI/PurR family transcriptional regulator
MAYGVMESARQLNLRIPQDVSVAGFDDLPTAAERYLPLTTIHQPVAEIGERSARILLVSLDCGVVEAGKTVVDVSLKIRESTAAPRSR